MPQGRKKREQQRELVRIRIDFRSVAKQPSSSKHCDLERGEGEGGETIDALEEKGGYVSKSPLKERVAAPV